MERKPLSTRVDSDLLKALKHLAVDEEVGVNDLLEEAIRDLLAKRGILKPVKKS